MRLAPSDWARVWATMLQERGAVEMGDSSDDGWAKSLGNKMVAWIWLGVDLSAIASIHVQCFGHGVRL